MSTMDIVSSSSSLLTGGYLIYGNTFTNNIGCPKYGEGAISLDFISSAVVIDKLDEP